MAVRYGYKFAQILHDTSGGSNDAYKTFFKPGFFTSGYLTDKVIHKISHKISISLAISIANENS